MARVLVGVPCFRLAAQVRQCIESLTNLSVTVVAVDNGADADVKSVLGSFGRRIEVIVSPTNEFCNGGWNRILEYGIAQNYDIIGLGSSDVILRSGWEAALLDRASNYSDEVWIPRIGDSVGPVEHVYGGVAGFFSFWPRAAAELVYPIPRELKHWYGDEYFFGKARKNGWKITILNNLQATHAWSSVTAATPEAYAAIEQDKAAWQRYLQTQRK